MWETVYIIGGLLKQPSEAQPEKVHADTQGVTAITSSQDDSRLSARHRRRGRGPNYDAES